jgi:hypothetical protein
MIMIDPMTMMIKMMKMMMMYQMMGFGGSNNAPSESQQQPSLFESVNSIMQLVGQMWQQFAAVTAAIPAFMENVTNAVTGFTGQAFRRSTSTDGYATQPAVAASNDNKVEADPMQSAGSEHESIYHEKFDNAGNKSEISEENNKNSTTAGNSDFIIDELVFRQFFAFLSSFDRESCLQKLMCDIHARADATKTHTAYEKGVLKMFRLIRKYRELKPDFLSGDKYISAAQRGTDLRSTVLCKMSYRTCKYTANEIIMGRGIYV